MDLDIFFTTTSFDLLELFLVLSALGALTGLLAGLLGIGGGLVLVPGLYFVFSLLGMANAHIMHVCVGTSIATVIFTGTISARSHFKRHSVDFGLVRSIGAGVVVGSILAGVFAAGASAYILKMIFVCSLVPMAIILGFDLGKHLGRLVRPSAGFYTVGGVFCGFLSTLMGIGGGSMNVPLMSMTGVEMRKAVGSAAALGVVIAVPATIGFIIIGWGHEGRPPFSLGYVNVLALACILPMSMAFAPLGVHLAHIIPTKRLRQAFAVFLLIVAIKMGSEIWE